MNSAFDTSLFPHGRWLMCLPHHFDVKYEINPWMKITVTPTTALAVKQWQALHHTLIRLGAWVEYMDSRADQPDIVFTANAGLVCGSKAVLSCFKYPERQGEAKWYREWFEGAGYQVAEINGCSFEGEGDALFAGGTLFCGYGFRSEIKAHEQAAAHLGVSRVVLCELVDPRFYHLDTCFCPLTDQLALFVPTAFSAESVQRMESAIELIPVPASDAAKFACNTVVLGKQLVMPAGCDETVAALRGRGFETYQVDLTEFMKAGGAAKCLSLKLDR